MDTVLSGTGGEVALDSVPDFARKFVQKLAYLEPCAYKGPVHVTVRSRRNKEEKEEYPVYCNQSDQMYKKSTKIAKEATTGWDLQKTGRESAAGTVHFRNRGRTEIVEENGCYKCPSGRHRWPFGGQPPGWEKAKGRPDHAQIQRRRYFHSLYQGSVKGWNPGGAH
jgi:hypothetical protein